MGYNTTTRRTVNVSVNGNAYDERNLIGMAYVIEQATQLRQPASMVNPSMYRCAHTVPLPPFAARGHCNPDYDTIYEHARREAADPAVLARDRVGAEPRRRAWTPAR